MKSRRWVAAVGWAVAVAVLAPVPALADPSLRLTDQVTDRAGALGPDRAPVDAALTRLHTDTGIRLYVVFVRSFDGVPRQEWSDRTARMSGLGPRDYLLSIAVGDRLYASTIGADSRVGKGARAAVARNDIEPALTRSDWTGAVIGAADGYRAATTGTSASAGWWIAALLVAAGGGLVWSLARRRRRGPPVSPAAVAWWSGVRAGPIPAGVRLGPVPVPDDVGRLLLDLDDRVRGAPDQPAAADLREAFRWYWRDAADPRVVEECEAAEGRLAGSSPSEPTSEPTGKPTGKPPPSGWLVDPAAATGWDAADRVAWARAVLPGALEEVRSLIETADPIVGARAEAYARAAMSEARRHLARAAALIDVDPPDALAEARQAHELAATAAGG